ncbi:hypothetical protein RI367_001538 [Sorochytrium milnesiophthora]
MSEQQPLLPDNLLPRHVLSDLAQLLAAGTADNACATPTVQQQDETTVASRYIEACTRVRQLSGILDGTEHSVHSTRKDLGEVVQIVGLAMLK